MHEGALHRDADLAAVRECALNGPGDGSRKIRTRLDDHGGVVSQLERDLLEAGARLDGAADFRAAGEREHRDPRMLRQGHADHRAAAGDDVVRTFRNPRFLHSARQAQRAERRPGGRFMHHGIACGQRRSDLVQSQVERHVEGSNTSDHADGFPYRDGHAAFAGSRKFHGNDFAAKLPRLVGGGDQSFNRPRGFYPGLLDRLAGFRTDDLPILREVPANQLRHAQQQIGALVIGQFPHRAESAAGGLDCRFHQFHSGAGNRAHRSAVVWEPHHFVFRAVNPFPSHEISIRLRYCRRCCHLTS